MTDKLDKLRDLVYKHNNQVVIDNDFDNANNLPFKEFKDIDKPELIELLFIFLAILQECVDQDESDMDEYLKELLHQRS